MTFPKKILAALAILALAAPGASAAPRDDAVFADCGASGVGFWTFWNGQTFPTADGSSITAAVTDRASFDAFADAVRGGIADLDLGDTATPTDDPVAIPVAFLVERFAELFSNFQKCADQLVADTTAPGSSNSLAEFFGSEPAAPPRPGAADFAELYSRFEELVLGQIHPDASMDPGICTTVMELKNFDGWTATDRQNLGATCAARATETLKTAEDTVATRAKALWLADRFYAAEWWVDYLALTVRRASKDLGLIENSLKNLDFVLPKTFVRVTPSVKNKLKACEF